MSIFYIKMGGYLASGILKDTKICFIPFIISVFILFENILWMIAVFW